MKIEVTIEKRHFLFIMAGLLVCAGVFLTTAYDSNPANPATLGHTANEIGAGSNGNVFGGSSTFNGASSSWYSFPGHLGVGQGSLDVVGDRSLQVRDSDGPAGIGLDSAVASGNTYIDFMKQGSIGANIDYINGALRLNSHPNALNTLISLEGSSVLVSNDDIYTLQIRQSNSASPGAWDGGIIGFFNSTSPNRLYLMGVDPNGNFAIWNNTAELFVFETSSSKAVINSLKGNGVAKVCADSLGRLCRDGVAGCGC